MAMTALMASVLVYTGALETIANFGQLMPVTRMSRGWQYLSVPVAGALMLVYLVPLTRRAWRGELRITPRVPDGE
jgi:TRAP-type C4-dicarboxylate transport system permease small subunit